MKRMRKESSIDRARESELRLESDLHEMADVVKKPSNGVLSDQHEYRNAGLSDSRLPAYDNRNVGLMQSPVAQILSTTVPTVVCEADKGETREKKIVENENETNLNRQSDKRNSPPKTHDMNTVNDVNTNSKPIQVRISNMAFSEVKRNPKTKFLLLSRIKADLPRKS
ncbi:hypothetical protein CHS0354_035729 [Potamilus streckersoni]|uniref:Uncharacterized protein n=1 Tax=Potamilus streckersoni TaxID=2493646 RepID=A0AAE0VLL7_9BIVA|nr:hypothetical protein CHS0354_035729 [Potamilus streckersoni]